MLVSVCIRRDLVGVKLAACLVRARLTIMVVMPVIRSRLGAGIV